MQLIQNEFYHVYNRGNNKQIIFFNPGNYIFFIKNIRKQILPCAELICYCLMPNHFHLIIQATKKSIAPRNSFGGKPMQEFAYRMGILLSSYSQAINRQNGTSGSLFQQKTKAKILCDAVNGKKDTYLEDCFFYIHNNPLEAGVVKLGIDWPYSSYLDYIGSRNGTLCNKELFLQISDLSTADICSRANEKMESGDTDKFYL
jgi:putative transposase